MTPEQKAAYVQAQAACAIIEALGMMSENLQRVHRGESMAYDEKSFCDVILRNGIHHNVTISFLGHS